MDGKHALWPSFNLRAVLVRLAISIGSVWRNVRGGVMRIDYLLIKKRYFL